MVFVMSDCRLSLCEEETKTLHFAIFSFPDILSRERKMHLKSQVNDLPKEDWVNSVRSL